MVETETGAPAINTATALRAIVDDFSRRPLQNGKQMRDLLRDSEAAFRAAAPEILCDFTEERGCRYLVTMLWSHNLLIPAITDPAVLKATALKAGEHAAKVDPQLHIRIMRYLTEAMLDGCEAEEEATNRLLEILSAIANSDSLGPFLRRMLLHSSARVRSKVTILIGRGQAGVKALDRLLEDEDVRVRANAVEALWHRTDPDSIAHFRNSLEHTSNRVAGNAVVGLYLAGQTEAISAALKMLKHDEAPFRQTAAWVMGKTLDSRFLPLLARLVGASDIRLRQAAFRAVQNIKSETAARAASPAPTVTILECRETPENNTSLWAAVTGNLSHGLKGTDWLVMRGTEAVSEYSVREVKSQSLALSFLLPKSASQTRHFAASVENAMKGCLERKRRTEQWSIARYQRHGFEQNADRMTRLLGQDVADSPFRRNADVPVVQFTAEAAQLTEQIASPSSRSLSTGLMESIRALLGARVPGLGARHLIVVADEPLESEDPATEEIARAAQTANYSVHALSTVPNEALNSVCRATGGFYREIGDGVDAGEEITSFHTAAGCHYVIEFTGPLASGSHLRVKVSAKAGLGEASWISPGLERMAS